MNYKSCLTLSGKMSKNRIVIQSTATSFYDNPDLNGIKTTGRARSQIENAIPTTSTGAVASSQGARACVELSLLHFFI